MIILRQKQYNIIGDLYHSGAKRTGQKQLGRVKSSISGYYNKKAAKKVIGNHKALDIASKVTPVHIENKQPIYDAAKNVKIRINRGRFDSAHGGAFTVTNNHFKEYSKELRKNLTNSKAKTEYDIETKKRGKRLYDIQANESKRDIAYFKEQKKAETDPEVLDFYNNSIKDEKKYLKEWRGKANTEERKIQELKNKKVTDKDLKKI